MLLTKNIGIRNSNDIKNRIRRYFILEGTLKDRICCIGKADPDYPEKMKNLPNMPDKLYYLGQLPDFTKPSIAVVGARMCSAYGRTQAFHYARTLSGAGVQVISGMAQGIDAEGHKGAIEGGTPTFAVLGNGVDICYPAFNRKLYSSILEHGGGILSELPPGTQPRPWYFPARNRIISAISDVVLVVEAKERSGSLITAGTALDQGRGVYAVPGAVNSALSKGCHRLIYDGAGIAYSPEVLLAEWGISGLEKGKSDEKRKLVLAKDLDLVYSCLDLRPKNPDDIIIKTGLLPGRVSSILTELELMGLIREVGRHYYVRRD